jgi:hypothetical protein
LLIQDGSPHLQKAMRMSWSPRHLLPLHKPLADHLVDRRLDEARRDRLAMAVAVPVIAPSQGPSRRVCREGARVMRTAPIRTFHIVKTFDTSYFPLTLLIFTIKFVGERSVSFINLLDT